MANRLPTKEEVDLINQPGSLNNLIKPKDLSYGIKTPMSLVPPVFIREVAKCMEDGAKKRAPYNWRSSKISAMQTMDKILRHTLDYLDGKDVTEDSKLSNLASAAADIAVLLDAKEHGVLVDDRPKPTIVTLTEEEMEKCLALKSLEGRKKYIKHLYPESWSCKKKLCLCKFKRGKNDK